MRFTSTSRCIVRSTDPQLRTNLRRGEFGVDSSHAACGVGLRCFFLVCVHRGASRGTDGFADAGVADAAKTCNADTNAVTNTPARTPVFQYELARERAGWSGRARRRRCWVGNESQAVLPRQRGRGRLEIGERCADV